MPRFRPSPGWRSTPETPVSPPIALVRTVLAAALLVTLPSAAVAQGRIDLLNSRGEVAPLAGTTILSETLDTVQFQRLGSSRSESRDTSRVVHVVYGKGSPSYELAHAALEQGDLRNAISQLTTASRETSPAWMAPHALLELAELQSEQGADHVNEALATVQRFLEQYPDHRVLPEALLLEARFASALGDRAAADEAVRAVLDLAAAGRITADWTVRAHLVLGRALLAAGDAKAAGKSFADTEQASSTVRSRLSDRPDLLAVVDQLALAARSGTGAALLGGGDVAGARAYFERLQRDGGGNAAIRAAAANGLAEADFMQNKLKDAQLGFARVAVTAAGTPDEHAKALYYLGRCAEELAQAGAERNGRTAAREYFEEVQKRYPGSDWARLARESLP